MVMSVEYNLDRLADSFARIATALEGMETVLRATLEPEPTPRPISDTQLPVPETEQPFTTTPAMQPTQPGSVQRGDE
jgi:hypothetical protein